MSGYRTSIPLLSVPGRWRPGHLLRGLGSGVTNGLANVSPFGALNFYRREHCLGQNFAGRLHWALKALMPICSLWPGGVSLSLGKALLNLLPTLPLGAAEGSGACPSLPGSVPEEGSIFTGGLCSKEPHYKKTLAF